MSTPTPAKIPAAASSFTPGMVWSNSKAPWKQLPRSYDRSIDFGNLVLQENQVLYAEANQLAVVFAHSMTIEGAKQFWNLLLGAAFGKLRDLFRCGFSLQQGVQHELARGAEYIR
jgi:hypothetical protein